MADAELAAEHAEQIKLASLHSPPADRDRPVEKRLRAAVGNLGVYAVCLGVVPDAQDRAAVVALMRRPSRELARPRKFEEAAGVWPCVLAGERANLGRVERIGARLTSAD